MHNQGVISSTGLSNYICVSSWSLVDTTFINVTALGKGNKKIRFKISSSFRIGHPSVCLQTQSQELGRDIRLMFTEMWGGQQDATGLAGTGRALPALPHHMVTTATQTASTRVASGSHIHKGGLCSRPSSLRASEPADLLSESSFVQALERVEMVWRTFPATHLSIPPEAVGQWWCGEEEP